MDSKKKQLIIELDGEWVREHRYDDEYPADVIKAELSKSALITVEDSTLTTITIAYDEKVISAEAIQIAASEFFMHHYGLDKWQDIMIFSNEDQEETQEEVKAEKKEQESKGGQAPEKQECATSVADTPQSSVVEDTPKESEILKLADKLVGADEFKELAREIVDIAGEIKRTNTQEVFVNQWYLYSIGDGYGLTTYLDIFTKLVEEQKICKMSQRSATEVRLGIYKEDKDPFEKAYNAFSMSYDKNVKVVCVDISEWMDHTNSVYFKHFMRFLGSKVDNTIVVFRIPFVEKDVLTRMHNYLADMMNIRTITFPPLTQSDMKISAEEEFKRHGFDVAKSAWKYFFERISEEKSDGKFYGVKTVQKVVREIIYNKLVTNARKGDKRSNQIMASDIKALCEDVNVNTLSGMEQLDLLVGVDSIKQRIMEIISQIEVAMSNKSVQSPCIHMRFVGNPGTGKTTVARIIGKILKEKGVLRVGSFFEYAGRDFCGRYIGETAPKTSGICRDAYGSVLFIDEAYSLYRGGNDSKDYGREALDTLIAEMENHRNDFVVIMAGYTDDMENLMNGNIGLASRMPYTIEFPNFTREQLNDIFVSMVKSKFKYDKDLFEASHEFFMSLPDSVLDAKEFSNARFVRNLFERTWAKSAMRSQLSGKKGVVLTKEDFEHAKAEKEFANNTPKKTRRIGFNN